MIISQEQTNSQLGAAIRILLATERRKFRLAAVELQLLPAIHLGQISILYNDRQVPVAYAVWAYLSDQVMTEMIADKDRLLHFSEWNEGTNLWLVDFVAPHRHVRALARKLRETAFKDFDYVNGFRHDQGLRNQRSGKVRLLSPSVAPA